MKKQAMLLYNHSAESGGKKKDSSQKNLPIKWLMLSTHDGSEIIEEMDYLPQQICNLHMTGLR
jgi:hypothetical protein